MKKKGFLGVREKTPSAVRFIIRRGRGQGEGRAVTCKKKKIAFSVESARV